MTHNLATTNGQLDALWREEERAHVLAFELRPATKIAVISDLHMGDGGRSDDLRRNTSAVAAALRHYAANGFTVILLGDVEDFWKFDLAAVKRQYEATIYRELASLDGAASPPRRIRVFGNHDIEWRALDDPATGDSKAGPRGAPEAVILKREGRPVALMVHGHQGSIDSDKAAWFSRFFVHIWGSLIEPAAHAIGWYPTNPAATECRVMADFERSMYSWAKRAGAILICGHSHRAYFASRSRADVLRQSLGSSFPVDGSKYADAGRRKELKDERRKGRDIGVLDDKGLVVPCYFNSGCGLYTTGLTAIEIDGVDDQIRLVFWNTEDGTRKVRRHDDLSGLLRDVTGRRARKIEQGAL